VKKEKDAKEAISQLPILDVTNKAILIKKNADCSYLPDSEGWRDFLNVTGYVGAGR
jgi:hypothetical protein